MRTVVLGEPPVEFQVLLEKRRALGQDRFDEVWEGELHMVPAPDSWHGVVLERLARVLGPLADAVGLWGVIGPNLGVADNFRVPDQAFHRGQPSGVWLSTAALVVEVLSPHDETWLKFDFYAAHQVDEICVADPRARTLQWFRREGAGYARIERSELLDVAAAELATQVKWPS